MALNLCVCPSPKSVFCSATANQPIPMILLDPSSNATARTRFSFSSASNSKNSVNMGMAVDGLSLRTRSDRVLTVTRSGFDTAGATVGQVTEVNKDTFWPIVNAAAAADKTVVLDMYTQWCGPCKVIAPKFEQLSEKYLDVVFLKLDCNQENKPLAKELGIRVVPTFKILKDAKVVKEVTGAKFDDLVLAIESVRSS
ncbi:hypothetical protein L6164_010683 [Bauhinia variegata]|uniref:Uncharacterized protein n=1 Tax=Bauhinia variegata TaxID=167791 RepID=A0ACB9PMV9_BAUVA|nr:hypothetical protein L6164_010683 [Bauhinia variegata]